MHAFHALAGITLLVALAWALSEDRRGVRWRVVASGLALTVVLAALLLSVPWLKGAVFSLNAGLVALERSTQAGATFVFGFLAGGRRRTRRRTRPPPSSSPSARCRSCWW